MSKKNGEFKYCGCYFSAPLWAETETLSKKTNWKCELDWDRVQLAFPDEYEAAISAQPNLRNMPTGTCGLKYRPHKDGPAMLVELLLDEAWIPLVSACLPEHIVDRFKQAQAEWYEVLQSDKAADVKMRILQHATKPCTNLVQDCPLQCVGKFPLRDFYDEGHQALSAVDWVKYFVEVADKGGEHQKGLQMFSKVCHRFLKKKGLEQAKVQPEMLPSSLSKGSRGSTGP